MNDDNQIKKQNELNEAGTNTAHVAGKTAATYFGGTLGNVVYDKLSNTKLGQGIEKGVGNVIGNTPILNQVNKKANDVGAVDTAGKAVDSLAGRGLNKKNPRNLRNTSNKLPNQINKNSNLNSNNQNSNTNFNIPKALQNRGNNQNTLNRLQNSYSNSVNEEDNHDEVEDDSQDRNASTSETLESKKNLLVIKRLLPVLLPIAIIIFIAFFLIVLLSNPIATVASFFSFEYQGTDKEAHYFNYNDPERLEEERAYNERLLKIIEEYQEKYNVEIDKYLLHSVVVYRYFTGGDSSEENTNYINYKKAINTLDEVANLMVIDNGDGTYTTDSEEDGLVYNNLVDSDFLKNYYKDYLKDDEVETRKRLVDEIYYFMQYAMELLFGSNQNSFLSETLAVYMQTCDQPYKYTINERGNRVFDNKGVNEGTSYPAYLSMTDYLKGVVLAELGTSYMTDEYREGVKAFVVAATNFALGSFGVDFYPGVESIGIPSGDCRQLTCDPNYGCSYNKEEFSTTFTGVDRYETQSPGWKKPLTRSQQEYMDSILDEVFGEVMVKKGITTSTFTGGADLTAASYRDNKLNSGCGNRCLGQEDAMEDAKNGMTYTEILDKYYDSTSYDIINIKEGLYYTTDSYGSFDGTVTYYRQTDYKNKFCGREGSTISSSGCGVTSAAMIATSLTGNKMYTPVYMMEMAYSAGACGNGISGTNAWFFQYFAKKLGFKHKTYSNKQTDQLIEALSKGNALAIAHMGPGHFTRGGHYIVLAGVNEKGQVLVYDPNNKNNNIYWDINTIADELKSNFYVIIKE